MHIPVLCEEIKKVLTLKKGDCCIDGTLGAGGYARMMLHEIMPGGILLGCDRDADAVRALTEEFATQKGNIFLRHANYATIPEILKRARIACVQGAVLDLGFSSDQIEDPERGFSFLHDAPLDMRYDTKENIPTAADIVRNSSEKALAHIFLNYGEERFAERIAETIVHARKRYHAMTTQNLVDMIARAVPSRYLHQRIHPATRAFQALRIAVNHELEYLETFLENIPRIMCHGGRVAIVSFHSFEDRIIKHAFQKYARAHMATAITKKPIVPTQEEMRRNPRSRSAKLRGLLWL